ncbi:HAD family hydrolase [Actinomadura sp. 7K507]|uniref:HAD family hydrolase n=1 Tax=Actinomadura sp. 7K507 TaxID=2530365 RepID=UPI001FB831CF|nr:HAD family hydrolase [Actinomadura sp. 7K507]
MDYGGTLASNHDAINHTLGMRPVTANAEQVIWDLDQAGVTLALVSNTQPGQDRRRALKAAHIDGCFGDRVYLSSELGVAKPDRRIWEHVLADLAVAPEHLLYCGNNLAHDIYPAAAQGIRTVLLNAAPLGSLPPGATCIAAITQLPGLLTGTDHQDQESPWPSR